MVIRIEVMEGLRSYLPLHIKHVGSADCFMARSSAKVKALAEYMVKHRRYYMEL